MDAKDRQQHEVSLETRQLHEFQTISAKLLSLSSTSHKPQEIEQILAELHDLVATNRISARHAQILGYLSQLILDSDAHVSKAGLLAK
jgi:hypothetical protein